MEARWRPPRRRRRLDGVRVAATARQRLQRRRPSNSGDPANYPAETATYVPEGRLFVANTGGHLFALSQKCPHLGCRVPFCDSSGRFECPCHGSKYDLGGEWIEGPAPRGMDRYDLSLVGGTLVVDTSKLIGGPDRGRHAVPHARQGPVLRTEGLTPCPRERPTPPPFEPAELERSLDRYLAVGPRVHGRAHRRVRRVPRARADAARTTPPRSRRPRTARSARSCSRPTARAATARARSEAAHRCSTPRSS